MNLAKPRGIVGFLETGKQDWLHVWVTHVVTQGPVLGLMPYCCYSFEILHLFWTGDPVFSFCTGFHKLHGQVYCEDQGVRVAVRWGGEMFFHWEGDHRDIWGQAMVCLKSHCEDPQSWAWQGMNGSTRGIPCFGRVMKTRTMTMDFPSPRVHV